MRAGRWLLVLVVLLAVVLVVADRVGVWAAQRVVADQVAAELASNQVRTAPPEVSIDRVPFLTQVATGRYESVTVRLRDVGTGGFTLPLVELTATGVSASLGTLLSREGPIIAEQVDGTATIGYASVAALPPLDELELSAASEGRLQVRVLTDLLGAPTVLTGVGEVAAVDGTVRVRVDSLTLEDEGGVPPEAESIVADIAAQLSITVPLPPLPYGLTVDWVRAEAAGLVVGVSARDVPLAG